MKVGLGLGLRLGLGSATLIPLKAQRWGFYELTPTRVTASTY